MDSTQIIVTISGLVLICLTLWFFFGKGRESKAKNDSALYACPMHPWITGSDPAADCQVCGMKLVRHDAATN